jgi:hypothetical protein
MSDVIYPPIDRGEQDQPRNARHRDEIGEEIGQRIRQGIRQAIGKTRDGRRGRADDAAAQHTRARLGGGVDDAGLPWRYAVFAVEQQGLDAIVAPAQQRGLRRACGAHANRHLQPLGRQLG